MMGIGVGIKNRLIFTFIRTYIYIPVVVTAGIVLFASCTKQSEFDIGKDFLDSQTHLQMIDTFRVDLSTIIQDSLRTSGTKIAMVGQYSDDLFGAVGCETYFDLAYESFESIEDKANFDSAAFILPFTGYAYGDTLSPMSVEVHSLSKRIYPGTDGYLYSVNSFAYLPEIVGSKTFYPEPNSKEDTSLNIRVDLLGEDLFNKIRDKDENVTSSEWFLDYIKGFVVKSGNTENKAVLGFNADENKIALKIYYHIQNEEPELKEITISMGETNHQFNHVNYDYSSTLLNSIKSSGNKKKASETDYKSYMQGLTGLITKVQFPSLQDIFLNDGWKILKAELVLEPVRDSYDKFELPEKLYIYQTDRVDRASTVLRDERGNSISALIDGDNNALSATFVYDKVLGDDTRYTYDITSYIISELSGKYFEYRRGLHIALSQDDFRTTLDRILFEGKKPPVKLRLYYLSY